jgi:hypothetical protein
MARASVLGRWILFFNFKVSSLLWQKVFPLIETRLLVMCERIGEALQIVCEVLHTVQHQYTGARECSAHHGMALDRFSANS